jgi:hypothetical protein
MKDQIADAMQQAVADAAKALKSPQTPEDLAFLERCKQARQLAWNMADDTGQATTRIREIFSGKPIGPSLDFTAALVAFVEAGRPKQRDDHIASGTQSRTVVPPTTSRAETEGQMSIEAHVQAAPSARGDLSDPPSGGDSTGEDHDVDATHRSVVSPALSKSLPRPAILDLDEADRASRKRARIAMTQSTSGVYIHDSRGHAKLVDNILRSAIPGITRTKGRETIRNVLEYNKLAQIDIEAGIAQPGQTVVDCLSVDRIKQIETETFYTTTAKFFIAPEKLLPRPNKEEP